MISGFLGVPLSFLVSFTRVRQKGNRDINKVLKDFGPGSVLNHLKPYQPSLVQFDVLYAMPWWSGNISTYKLCFAATPES